MNKENEQELAYIIDEICCFNCKGCACSPYNSEKCKKNKEGYLKRIKRIFEEEDKDND